MTIITDLTLFTREAQHIDWWIGNVTSYFNSAKSDITLVNITGEFLTIRWSDNTITSPYTCPIDEIRAAYQRLDRRFILSLSQYLIQSISLELVGICTGFLVSPTTTQPPIEPTTTQDVLTTTEVVTTSTLTTRPEPVGTTLEQNGRTTRDPLLAQKIAIPLVILIIVLVVVIILVAVVRSRQKYRGKSRLDGGEDRLYRPRAPVLGPSGQPDEDEDDDPDSPFNDLYADEGITNDTFFPGPSPEPGSRGKAPPPPKYMTPPPYPYSSTANQLQRQMRGANNDIMM